MKKSPRRLAGRSVGYSKLLRGNLHEGLFVSLTNSLIVHSFSMSSALQYSLHHLKYTSFRFLNILKGSSELSYIWRISHTLTSSGTRASALLYRLLTSLFLCSLKQLQVSLRGKYCFKCKVSSFFYHFFPES